MKTLEQCLRKAKKKYGRGKNVEMMCKYHPKIEMIKLTKEDEKWLHPRGMEFEDINPDHWRICPKCHTMDLLPEVKHMTRLKCSSRAGRKRNEGMPLPTNPREHGRRDNVLSAEESKTQ